VQARLGRPQPVSPLFVPELPYLLMPENRRGSQSPPGAGIVVGASLAVNHVKARQVEGPRLKGMPL
jgi:hypothetical protein